MLRFLAILCVGLIACDQGKEPSVEPLIPQISFMKGATTSFVSYLEAQGMQYCEAGVACDPYISLQRHGANIVRLQYDLEPFADVDGTAINWQQLPQVKADARRAADAGLDLFLTIKPDRNRYSDEATVVNLVPTCWQAIGSDVPKLCEALRLFIVQSLESLDVVPKVVAVGNEVNLGFLSLEGQAWSAVRIARLLEAGCGAVAQYNATHGTHILTAVHIASPHHIDGVLPLLQYEGLRTFDIVAVSWYEGMDGHSMGRYSSFVELAQSVRMQYGRPLLVLETASSFTNGGGDNRPNAYYNPAWSSDTSAFSPAKQRAWLSALASDVKAGGGVGVLTWGAEALPGDKLWYYPAPWGDGSTWENNSFWDYNNGFNLHQGVDWMVDVK